jgi:hypothetical protein
MKELLKELEELLEKHNACVVRSANNRGDLFLCKISDDKTIEVKFNEEISSSSIKYSWHTEQSTH